MRIYKKKLEYVRCMYIHGRVVFLLHRCRKSTIEYLNFGTRANECSAYKGRFNVVTNVRIHLVE
jgi:hypothetical protein